MTGLFITQGPVVQVKDGNGDIDVLKDRDPSVAYTGPLIVLVNRLSASASEIFAAALQDYGRALIVGDSSTFGKGTVQTMLELGRFMPSLGNPGTDAGALKLTVQKFYRVAGGSTQLRGVLSDLTLPSLTDNPDIGEAALDHALPYDEVEPVALDVANNRKPLYIAELRKRLQNRLGQDTVFQELSADLKQMIDRIKTNRISLNEKERRDELDKDNAQKDKEKTDEKRIEKGLNDKHYELTLADLDKPQLRLLPAPSFASDTSTAKKPDDSTDPNASSLEDDSNTSVDGRATERETLDIMSDLIDLSKSPPRTVEK
jgi:carboxyl-terminal processing protease